MELVYADENLVPQGIIQEYSLDLAFGEDENDFELKISTEAARKIDKLQTIPYGWYVYQPGTEWGGVIDKKSLDNTGDVSEMTFYGRTWHGILAESILCPESGEDYLITPELMIGTDVINLLISSQGLGDVFEAGKFPLFMDSYQFSRYCDFYSGLSKMLANFGFRLAVTKPFKGKCVLGVEEIKDWSSGFDDNFMAFEMESEGTKINHLVCLGSGELKDRIVVNLYADKDGNISTTQTLKGIYERAEVYDYSSIEDKDELVTEGTKKLKEYQDTDSVEFDLGENQGYAIGDVITASSVEVALKATASINKIIVNVTNDSNPTIQYKTGEITTEAIK